MVRVSVCKNVDRCFIIQIINTPATSCHTLVYQCKVVQNKSRSLEQRLAMRAISTKFSIHSSYDCKAWQTMAQLSCDEMPHWSSTQWSSIPLQMKSHIVSFPKKYLMACSIFTPTTDKVGVNLYANIDVIKIWFSPQRLSSARVFFFFFWRC